MLKPAIFLDRDGTLNVEKHYLYKPADWEWIDGAIDSIRAFHAAGYLVVVVTNQAGIARGLFTTAEVQHLHRYVDGELAQHGTHIDAYYLCPHHPDFGENRACACRKPKPGMLHDAARDLGIDLNRSWLVGDKISDVNAATAAGVRGILVATGHGAAEQAAHGRIVPYAPDITAAARIIFSAS